VTIDEAIKHAEEVAEEKEKYIKRIYETSPVEERFLFGEEEDECKKCAEEHRQLAEWLRELKKLKEQEPYGDTISRQAAIEMATTIKTDDFSGNEILEVVDVDDIKALPPVTSQLHNAVIIPDDATNGDMIKAIFPYAVKRDYIESDMVMKDFVTIDFGQYEMRVSCDWWYAPYRAEKGHSMTKEEAIKNIKEHCYFANLNPQAKEALDMAIEALEYESIKALEQDICEDIISRQAVLAIARDSCLDLDSYEDTREFCDEIKALPPVTLQQKTGRWIYDYMTADGHRTYHCSECGCYLKPKHSGPLNSVKWCSFCGAKMSEV